MGIIRFPFSARALSVHTEPTPCTLQPNSSMDYRIRKVSARNFFGGLVVRALCFTAEGLGSIPGRGTKIL